MRLSLVLIVAAVALAAGWVLGMSPWRQKLGARSSSTQSGPTIEQVQALAQLVTERINISDVIESQLSGRTGSIRALVVVKGDVLISTDLSQARFESIDVTARRAVLVLPNPKVLEARLDHENTKVFAVAEGGLWRVTPGDNATSAAVIDLAYRDAQRFVTAAATAPALLAGAREHATQLLMGFFRESGWDFIVRWAE